MIAFSMGDAPTRTHSPPEPALRYETAAPGGVVWTLTWRETIGSIRFQTGSFGMYYLACCAIANASAYSSRSES